MGYNNGNGIHESYVAVDTQGMGRSWGVGTGTNYDRYRRKVLSYEHGLAPELVIELLTSTGPFQSLED
jgi:hypothetical protein